MKFYHPFSVYPFPLAHAHLPRHGEHFCAKNRRKCFGPLGVITLWVHLPARSAGFPLPGNRKKLNFGQVFLLAKFLQTTLPV